MSVKTYLQEQIQLVSLSSYDLFTDEEFELYMQIIELKNEIDGLEEQNDKEQKRQEALDKKSKLKEQLDAMILAHANEPRIVRLKSVLYYPKDAEYPFPEGVTYDTLKSTKKIAEFCCELSRVMGLKHLDSTLDLIVVKWKNTEMLRQLVINGFYIPVIMDNGLIVQKHYHFFTASAGQLRRDKIVMIEDTMWEKIHDKIECGMTWDLINERGSINPNKLMAYLALSTSATEEWTDFDIDRVIVIPEFKAPVTDRMMYIKPDYSYEVSVRTVMIDHTDGSGMMLPEVSESNFMIRGPWIKGLLGSFDFIRFCKINNVKPVLTDAWGVEHDLIKERINIILTTSMFKLYNLYKNFDEYKEYFKKYHCHFCRTNYEEDYIKDTTINYQMLQTCQDFTDKEIEAFIKEEHRRIENITKNKDMMLKTLKADINSEQPYKVALALYPELLRETYSRNSLKDIKKRMVLDAKSGKIKCANKRVFVLPDFYAACQYWFMGEKNPKGLLAKDEIACKIFRRHNKADVLRSPHLYLEHSIHKITHDQNVYDWFYTNAVHTSVHSLVSRILQFDVDGDQLNVIVDPLFVDIAERNVKEFDIVPLFYESEKANAEPISNDSLFRGLKRAHDYSNIGEISDMLTRLWNRDKPDMVAAALLTYLNNLRIDGAKTGIVHEYANIPHIAKQIGNATGGKNGRMPFFFQFSKNGRKDALKKKKRKYADPNNSTMNRICRQFEDIGNINMNYAGVLQFNWQMLLDKPYNGSRLEIPQLFCELDSVNLSSIIESQEKSYSNEKQLINGYTFVAEEIKREIINRFGSLEEAYPFIVKYLFAGEGANRSAHKRMFWKVFGEIAVKNLKKNLASCDTCEDCRMRIPSWIKNHACIKNTKGFFECIDCTAISERVNSKQCRCDTCQKEYRKLSHKTIAQSKRDMKKELVKRFTVSQSSCNET